MKTINTRELHRIHAGMGMASLIATIFTSTAPTSAIVASPSNIVSMRDLISDSNNGIVTAAVGSVDSTETAVSIGNLLSQFAGNFHCDAALG
jgi:hypothetical protein